MATMLANKIDLKIKTLNKIAIVILNKGMNLSRKYNSHESSSPSLPIEKN